MEDFAQGSAQIDPEAAINALWNLQYTRLCAFVSATIVLYDCILSLEREIELVWRKRWSFIKVVYIWHRYFGLFCLLFEAIAIARNNSSSEFCSFWFHWDVWCYFGIVFSSEVTLLLWIWVVYNRKKWLLSFLSITFIVQIAIVGILLAISMPSEIAQNVLLPGRSFCITSSPQLTFKIVWVPILAYDLFLLAMFMYKGVRNALSRSKRPTFGVYHMVYRHTLVNFFAITASYIACVIIWLAADPGLAQIPVTFAMAFAITNCTRLLLNIRRAYYFGSDDVEPGLLSWSAIAGGQSISVPQVVALPRRHYRQRSSHSFPGEIEVAVQVAVEVEVANNENSRSSTTSFDGYRAGEYELSEIKTVD
ncbi:hypothetical protein BDW22DRAFT_1354959, partial [Trametopsis cervina]